MSVQDLVHGFTELDRVRAAYVARWDYYAGELPERFANERIKQLVESSASGSYRFRFSRKPVTALLNRVQVASITGKSDAVTSKLEAIRRANSMDMLEPFIHERTFAFGDCYALTWPVPDPPEDEPDPVKPDLRAVGVEITYQSPLSCRAIYDAEDGLRLLYVVRRWKTKDPLGETWHAEVWYPDGTIEPWVCQPGANGHAPETWTADTAPGEAWPLAHDYGMPIHHARNSLPYGRPEHADSFGPQDALTKLTVTQAFESEYHGWGERWELIDPAASQDTARDTVPWDNDTEAPATTPRTRSTGQRSGPGTRHILEGRKDTGDYERPNPSELVETADSWLRMLATTTDTPASEFDPERGAGLSGIARMWADKPLANREQTAKRFLLRFYRELYGKALEIAGMPGEEIDVAWARPDVIVDPDWWGNATVRRDHGVPQEVILQEANYDPDDIKKWLDADDEARTLLQRIEMAERLGTALQAIASAVALGAIDQARVDAIVARILGEHVIDKSAPAPVPVPAQLPPGQDVTA